MEETVRAMLVYKKQAEQLRQEKAALTLAFEVRYFCRISRGSELIYRAIQLNLLSSDNLMIKRNFIL